MLENQVKILNNIKDIIVDEGSIAHLDYFINELFKWNKKINLTSIFNYEEAFEKHLIDSLYISKYLKKQCRLVDMGSGAGLPGLPLAICRSDITVISIDSVGKKINFQNHIKRNLKLVNFKAVNARVENLLEIMNYQQVDIITARAFTSLEKLMEYASPVMGRGSVLLAMKGVSEEENLLKINDLVNKKGFNIKAVEKYNLPISLAKRNIIVLEKI